MAVSTHFILKKQSNLIKYQHEYYNLIESASLFNLKL